MKRRIRWVVLVFVGMCLAVRAGAFPSIGYEILYGLMIQGAEYFAVSQERAVLGFYTANCRPYRYARPVLWLPAERREGLNHLFTCSASTPLEAAMLTVSGRAGK